MSLSLLQVRNLAEYTILNPTPDPLLSDEQTHRYFKNEFRVTVPNSTIQTQIVSLQATLTKQAFLDLLPALRDAIDAIIPPVHTPTSLFDILSELRRFQGLADPIDQQILFIGYLPMISYFLDVKVLREALGTSGESAAIDAFVSDFATRLTTLQKQVTPPEESPGPPPFGRKERSPIYLQYRNSYQIARNDTDRLRSLLAYRNFINNVIDGGNRTIERLPTSTSVQGFYTPSFDPKAGNFMVYITEATPGLEIKPGWIVKGLSGVYGNVAVQSYTANVYSDALINPGPPAISFPYVSSAVVVSDMPNLDIRPSSIMRFTLFPPDYLEGSVTANVTAAPSFGLYDARVYDDTNIVGHADIVRDLNSNVSTSEGREVYHTVVDRGSGTGALISMAAIGAQEPYMFGGQSNWIPNVKQHTAFSLTHRLSLPLANVGGYLGKTVQVDLFPRECGDLLSNMYLQCSLPALPSGNTYTELIGRAIIDKVEFLVDGIVYESITDDWYVIHDQLFLDADEKLGMYQAVSNGTPEGTNVDATSAINLIVPLDFFFCHRFTHGRKRDKPYFPLCAVTLSTVSVRFTFNKQSWITASTNPIDLINPRLLIEEVHLTPEERMYYRSRPLTFKVPRVWKEARQTYTNGLARLNFTADFPVTMMVWFVRNKAYEADDRNFFESRYAYGYTSEYIQSATPVTFFNGVSLRYIDTIEYATLYLNNNNVLSNFPGGLYYTFKQPIDHGLSVPTKSMYMYCFSERPAVYNSGGALDFASLNAQTSHLDIKFLDTYAPQIASQFSLDLFYYGYVTLSVKDGLCTLLS
jgi:hypothetical protein